MGSNPQYVVGADGAQRVYAGCRAGRRGRDRRLADLDLRDHPDRHNPVYGVMTPDTRRAFILNQGSGTVSVINVANNALDNANPDVTLPNTPSGGAQTRCGQTFRRGLNSVAGNNQLVVLNQGDGTTPGTLTIINIPLCNQSAQGITRTACGEPGGRSGFGTIFATATVGVNPVMVSILQDGSRAYVVNAGQQHDAGLR